MPSREIHYKPAEITLMESAASAKTWRKAPLTLRLSLLDFERMNVDDPLANKPKKGYNEHGNVFTAAGFETVELPHKK